MEFFALVESRRSIRSFRPGPVEEHKLESILAAMNHAPSAGNLQAYQVVVVRDPDRRRLLARAAHAQDFVAEAPCVLVFLAEPTRSAAEYGSRGDLLFSLQDATLAAAYAQLAAHALGLGSVWVGSFDDSEARQAVRAPEALNPVCLLALGYPGEVPQATPRRDLDELVRHESWRR